MVRAVAALAVGTSIIEVVIENIKNIAIAIVAVLLLEICIFLFSLNFMLKVIPEFIYKAI
jgi:hypothetical protein